MRATKPAATYFFSCNCTPLSLDGKAELINKADTFDTTTPVADREVTAAARQQTASRREVQAGVTLNIRKCFSNCNRALFEQYVLWFQIPRVDAPQTFPFANGVARFDFGRDLVQVEPSREANVYECLPYRIKPKVDADIAAEVRRYLVAYYAGNKEAEMLERALEAISFLQLGLGIDKILVIKDDGRMGKTAKERTAKDCVWYPCKPVECVHPHCRR